MTGSSKDQLMIVAISRAAQLAYIDESAGAFAYLSAAERFFRYHASRDRTATLGEELQRLGDLATIDASFSLRVGCLPPDSGSLFIERFSLVDAALELAALPGEASPIVVEAAPEGDGDAACALSRCGEKRLVRLA